MFESSWAFLILAVLVVLALPAVWMLCEVAFDLPILGLALVAACGAAGYVLRPHVGVSLVDATVGLVGLSGAAFLVTAFVGTWSRVWRLPGPPELPAARLIR